MATKTAHKMGPLESLFASLDTGNGVQIYFDETSQRGMEAMITYQSCMADYIVPDDRGVGWYRLTPETLYAGSGATFLLECFLSLRHGEMVSLNRYGCLDRQSRKALVAMIAAFLGVGVAI